MIRYLNNFELEQYNTMNISAKCHDFFEFTEVEDILEFIQQRDLTKEKYFILGGGSNVLFVEDYDGLILHPNIPGIEQIKEDRNNVWFKVGAGVEWDDFVELSVEYNYGGIENLSAIPGKVGSSPVQNIGAYGVEAKDYIDAVHVIDIKQQKQVILTNEDCKFGYRDSIFKQSSSKNYIVTEVVYKLDKFPEFKLNYGSIKDEVGDTPTLAKIRSAIVKTRNAKLPDTKIIGNCGSYFKNPIVSIFDVRRIEERYKNVPQYNTEDDMMKKLPAGWLIEQCGWKGKIVDGVGTHEHQALVIVNHSAQRGSEIVEFAEKIRESVLINFGIILEPEVVYVK